MEIGARWWRTRWERHPDRLSPFWRLLGTSLIAAEIIDEIPDVERFRCLYRSRIAQGMRSCFAIPFDTKAGLWPRGDGPMVMHLQMHVHLQVRSPVRCRGTTGHGQMIPEKDHDCFGCR